MGTTLLTIALLHWVALVTPGPNFLVISNLAASGSRQAATYAALGIAAVAGLWSLLAVLGVHAIFDAHRYVRVALQIAGGGYLLYVALRFWRAGTTGAVRAPIQLSSLEAFRLGILTNILNPKAVLFFGSIFVTALPQDPSGEILLLAVILTTTNALIWHMTLAAAFSHHRIQAAYDRARKSIGRAAALLLGALGLHVVVAAVSQLRSR